MQEHTDDTIKEAILRELLRGGQVYFLHNEVDTIDRAAEHIRKLVPEARVIVAHGQMRERELEQVMQQFYHKEYNVLVCSTIIETGIDVPNANTILIERADKLGLAQLHQLRGRVGRSHHQAYAYLMVPSLKALKVMRKNVWMPFNVHQPWVPVLCWQLKIWKFAAQVNCSVSSRVVRCRRLVIACIWKCWKKRPKPFKRQNAKLRCTIVFDCRNYPAYARTHSR